MWYGIIKNSMGDIVQPCDSALRNGDPRTMSGGEPSSIKWDSQCAAASRLQGCTMSLVLF